MTSNDPAAILEQPALMANPAASRRLYKWGLTALVFTCIWFISENRWEIDLQTLLGIAIMALASRPALSWANRNQKWFPAFEIAMLTCIPFYAIPLLSHHPELRYYPENTITQASALVILYIIVSTFSFSLLKRTAPPKKLLSTSLIPKKMYNLIPWGICVTNIHDVISSFTNIIPTGFGQILRPLFFGIGTLSIFISARLWGLNRLSLGQKSLFGFNIILQIILLFSSLYLIMGISLFALAIISYSMAKRSVPWLVLLIFLPIISLLHLGKGQMRQVHWQGGTKEKIASIGQLPLFYGEWIGYALQADRIAKDTHIRKNTIFERASLMHMLSLAVDRVPRDIPYLKGETYIDIPALLLPRFIWKNKPSGNVATQRLGVYFGLVSVNDFTSVSIAFGMLAEAYINFGVLGIIGLASVFGLGLKRVALLSENTSQFSPLGILSILLTAWSLQVEQTAATWISSLLQASIFCIGLPMAYNLGTSPKKS